MSDGVSAFSRRIPDESQRSWSQLTLVQSCMYESSRIFVNRTKRKKGTHRKKKKKKEVSPSSFELNSEKNTARSRNVVYLDQRSFKRPDVSREKIQIFPSHYAVEILAAGETGPAKVRKNMGELREDLSQSDKLISALLPAYISIYLEKKLRLDRGTTNQSDSLLYSHERKSEMNLSPSRRIQQRVFTVIKSLFFHVEHLFFFLYINLIDYSEPSCSGVLVFVNNERRTSRNMK